MMETNSYIKPYFYIAGDKVIYPASTWKRVGARFIDIFLVNIFIFIFFAVLYSSIGEFEINEEIAQSKNYADVVPQLYSPTFMIVTSFGVIGLICLNLIIPLFNKKNPGQTFGKLLFSITPIFFTNSSKKFIVLRELPLTIIVIAPLIILLIMGGNPNFYYSQAQEFIKFGGVIDPSELSHDANLSFFYFVSHYLTNDKIMGDGPSLSGFAAGFVYLKQMTMAIYWIFLIVLWVSIAFNQQKMGLMDKLANTSVVDLKKVIDRSLIEGDPNYIEDTTLAPKDVSSNEGPPVELKK